MQFKRFTNLLGTAGLMFFLLACTPGNNAKTENAQAKKTESIATTAAENEERVQKDDEHLENLLEPKKLNAKAPDHFSVKMTTTKGDVKIELDRSLAPIGVDRFYNLLQNGFFNDMAIFKTSCGHVVQFGLHGNPKVSSAWRKSQMADEPVKGNNTKGTLVFSATGPETRNTQIFINLNDNLTLNQMGFPPFAKITEGMEVIESLNTSGDAFPDFEKIRTLGTPYLKENFPMLDYIVTMAIE